MIRKLYISAWFLLAAAALILVFTGSFNPVTLLVFSLIALVLVNTLMLWLVIVNTRDAQHE